LYFEKTFFQLFLTLLLEVRPVRDWRLLSSPVDVHCAPMQTQFTATRLVACCELHITHKQVCCRAALRCAALRCVSHNTLNCRYKLYDKSATSRSDAVRGLQLIDLQWRNFLGPWDRVPEGSTVIFGDTQISYNSVG